MIKDEQHYRNIQLWAQKFEGALDQLERNENEKVKNDPLRRELYMNDCRRKIEDLRQEIREYEELIDRDPQKPFKIKINSIDDIGLALLKARLVAKLTEKELADLAMLTEDKIKQYEDQDYQNASFGDVISVYDALNIQFQQNEIVVPLDTLRRKPITQEELLSQSINQKKEPVGELTI